MPQKSIIFFGALFFIYLAGGLIADEGWSYYMKKAEKQFAAEQYGFALENYARVLDRRPHETAALNRVAAIYLKRNEKRTALEYLSRSIAADPRQPDVQNAAGELKEFFADYPAAFHHYMAAIGADPSHLHARINLVRYYAALHDSAKASEHFEVCARLGKAEGDRLVAMGAAEEKKGNTIEALALYTQAVGKSPAHLDAFFHIVELYRRAGDPEAAILTLDRVKEIRPDLEKAYVHSGYLYFAQRFSPRRKYMLEQTIINAETALELNPGNREMYFLLADVYRFMGDDVKAAKLLEKADSLFGPGPIKEIPGR
ncbi:MAG: tetratricopeptide repeat protein [Spirochaetes bacterium]|nr:MAG: tetratricopeptide repeat protein [Spirochaetota bacterium]